MEIWKNKKTGKGFIYIDDTGLDEALLVNPEGKIMLLKKSLFEKELVEDEGILTEPQKKRYEEHEHKGDSDAIDTLLLQLFGCTSSEMTDRDWQELSGILKRHAQRELAKAQKYSEEAP